MKNRKIVLGISGSSGSVYAKSLMDKLKDRDIELGVVMSTNALTNWKIEIGDFRKEDYPFAFYEKTDFYAPFASGSAQYDTMIICPCSMGMVARIAHGISTDLISRAADVILKEKRKLILVPRETPLSLVHLKNLTALAEAGAVICPAAPSFYSKPESVADLVDTVVNRVMDLAGLESGGYRWGS